ncbi:hypothetical protein Tco_0256087 [Tanacetum coccineum]
MRNEEIIDDVKKQEMRSSSGIIEPNETEYFSRADLSACKQFEQLRREAAAVKIEMDFKCFIVSKSYQTLGVSKVALQTGLLALYKHFLLQRVFRRLLSYNQCGWSLERDNEALKEAKDNLEKWSLQLLGLQKRTTDDGLRDAFVKFGEVVHV